MITKARKPEYKKSFYWKALFDRGIASLLLIPGIPILIFLGALIRLTSKGPSLFSQARVGKDGKPFTIHKLRSMHQNAERENGPTWAVINDPRTTWLGHYLRKFHLDEIPQLFNVLRGEMSLVGPRPERPEFVEVLKKKIPNYTDRLNTLPGITGLAQLNLPADTNLNSVRRKQMLDLEYLQKATPWLDFRIFLCTFGRLVKFHEKPLLKVLGLHRATDNQTLFQYHMSMYNVPHELLPPENIGYERSVPISMEGSQSV